MSVLTKNDASDIECMILIDGKNDTPEVPTYKDKKVDWKAFKKESIELWKLAIPICMTNVLQFMLNLGTSIITGRLPTKEFDAASLSVSTTSTYGIYLIWGFCTACDTIFAQTFGSGESKRVGMWLQKSLLIINVFILFMIAVHLNSEMIFLLLGQEPEIAKLAANFSTVMCPAFVCYANYFVLVRYLQNMNKVYPPAIMTLVAATFNVVSQIICLQVLGLGYQAVPFCHAGSYVVLLIEMLIYIFVSKVYRDTWDGLKRESMTAWKELSFIGICGICQTAIESICFHTAVLVAGTMNAILLGAQSILYNICTIIYMLPYSVAVSVNIRVGQALGNLDCDRAKFSCKVAAVLTMSITITIGIILAACRTVVPLIFTNISEIIDAVAVVVPVISLVVFLDGLRAVTDGALRGCGRQGVGAAIILIPYFGVCMTGGISLMLFTEFELMGFWAADCMAISTSFFLSIIFLKRLNWNAEAIKAQARVLLATENQKPNEKTQLIPKNRTKRQYPREPRSCSTNFEVLSQNPKVTDSQFRRECIKRGLIYGLGIAAIAVSLVLRFTVFPDYIERMQLINATTENYPELAVTTLSNVGVV